MLADIDKKYVLTQHMFHIIYTVSLQCSTTNDDSEPLGSITVDVNVWLLEISIGILLSSLRKRCFTSNLMAKLCPLYIGLVQK